MTRPGAAEWSVLDLDSDPVPGDPESFEEITRAYQELARTTQEAHDLLASGGSIDVGQGKAMEAFKDLIGKLPRRLDVMAQSYGRAADAYLAYLPSLEEAQKLSLRALDLARQASADQAAAGAAVLSAVAAVNALGGDTAPDPDAQAEADKSVADAKSRRDEAQQSLDQAKSILGLATALRDQAAQTSARILDDLADDAPQRSLWEKIAEAFHAFVDFLRSTVIQWITTVLDVLSTIAFFIFPPLGEAIGLLSGAIDFAAAVVGGDAGEIAMAVGGLALGLVPGGRLAARVIKLGKTLSTKAGKAGAGAVKSVDNLVGTGKQVTGGIPGRGGVGNGTNRPPDPKDTATKLDLRECLSDPVDVATGEMVLAEADFGLERTHVSSYLAGGWFGSSWASTLDQRLEADPDGVCFFAPDGMILVYANAVPGEAVLPVEGPRWPLVRFADGTAELTDPSLGRSTTFRALGSVFVVTGVTGPDGSGQEFEWDEQGLPVAVVREDGHRVEIAVTQGRVSELRSADETITFGYDDGRLTAVTNDSGLAKRFEYDESRIIGWTDRAGYRYRYTYDTDGRCVRTEGERGFLTATFVYDGEQRTTTYTDSMGQVSVYRFNERHRMIERTDPLGRTTRWAWDEQARMIGRTDPLGHVTRYFYAEDGSLASVLRADGSLAEINGDLVSVDGHTRTYARLPAEVGVADTFEDVFGTPDDDAPPSGERRVRAGRHQVTYDADGNPIENVDASGNRTAREYGPFGLVLASVDELGARTVYEYDTELRIVAVTNPAGRTWRYGYDAAGQLIEQTDFTGRVQRFEYDAAGRLLRSVNGLGEAVEHEYDALGNLIRRGETTFVYDPVGRLVSATGGDVTMELTRDGRGRIVRHTVNGRTLAFDYGAGEKRRLTPAGIESTSTFDAHGRLASLSTGGHTMSFGVDFAGRELSRHLDGHEILRQSFDIADRLLTQLRPGQPERRYEYDADGLLTGIEDGAGRTSLELDPAGRVAAVHGPGRSETYRYDIAGALAADEVGYMYDAQGRVVARTVAGRTWSYDWDIEDRLTGVRTPDGEQWRYLYDPLGRRIAKFTDAERWDFVWDGMLLVEQTRTGTDGRRHTITWDHDLDQRPVAEGVDDEFFSIVTDLVGTPRELVAADGRTSWRSDASAWGVEAAEGGTPLRFPGQYFDAETGLHYNVYRYYDPLTGRYLSQDPLGLAPSPLPSAYVANPFADIDPLGLVASKRAGSCTAGASTSKVTPGAGAGPAQVTKGSAVPGPPADLQSMLSNAHFNDELKGLIKDQVSAESKFKGKSADAIDKEVNKRFGTVASGGRTLGNVGTERKLADIVKKDGVGKQLLDALDKAGRGADGGGGQLKIFRTMEPEDAEKLKAFMNSHQGEELEKLIKKGMTAKEFHAANVDDKLIMPVKKHLGDLEQASRYKGTTMEFTLKPGAHKVLFSPEFMALAADGKGAVRSLSEIGKINKKPFPIAKQGEGELPGFVGLKSEEGTFSFSLGNNNATRLVFQLMVDKVEEVPRIP